MKSDQSRAKLKTTCISYLLLTFILYSCSGGPKQNADKTESKKTDTISNAHGVTELQDTAAAVPDETQTEEPEVSEPNVTTPEKNSDEIVVPVITKEQANEIPVLKPQHLPKPSPAIQKNKGFNTPASKGVKKTKKKTFLPKTTEKMPVKTYSSETVVADQPATAAPITQPTPSAAESPDVPEPVKKSASLAYNFPAEMKRNVSEDINVYVSLVNSGSFVKDTLMKIIARQKNPDTGKSKTDSIVTTNILLYKRLKIELIDPDSAFRIKQIYGNDWQEVDSTGDNRWRWNVVPLTNLPEAKLVIKVVAETPSGAQKDIDDRTFYIRIKMTGPFQMIRSWLTYLQDNPGLVLTVILIPLIAFFGKRYFERRAKNKNT